MNCAGLIYDDSKHYLDHLAPFCALIGAPLILCEPALADLARQYYPDLTIFEQKALSLNLPPYVITCDNRPLLQAAFPHQSIRTLWLPHGRSDKGWNSSLFEQLKQEHLILVYGQKMADLIPVKNRFLIGNFRYHYFQKHQKFYENIYGKLPKTNYLYAPTWDDSEKNNSFWTFFPRLAKALPPNQHLLIKLHPNTCQKFSAELELLMARYANQKNILFLPNLPPIYPLLSLCDSYIGDMSSIGYDFLTFNKPMYFLNAKSHLPLHRCGPSLSFENLHFPSTDPFSSIRKSIYNDTFAPDPNWEKLKEELDAMCCI